ncbi:uncharacterized protein METZ01_LOCUS474909, partial [marine metagenome]
MIHQTARWTVLAGLVSALVAAQAEPLLTPSERFGDPASG